MQDAWRMVGGDGPGRSVGAEGGEEEVKEEVSVGGGVLASNESTAAAA